MFFSSYGTFHGRYAHTVTRKLKSLSEEERDRLGLNDGEDEDHVVNRSQRKLTPVERSLIVGKPLSGGTDGNIELVEVKEREKMHFGLVVLDEAHQLKGETTVSHQAVASIKRDSMLLVSATPLINHPKDILSYLRLGFSNLPNLRKIPRDMDLAELYGTNFAAGTAPFKPLGTVQYKTKDGSYKVNPKSQGVVLLDQDAEDDGTKERLQALEDANLRWWTFHPDLFRRAARQQGWTYDSCRNVVGQILQQLFMRRTMTTVLEMPDGTERTPGEELPGAVFKTVQCALRGAGKAVYDEWHGAWESRLFTAVDEPSRPTVANPLNDSTNAVINAGVWRKLDILALDPNNCKPLDMKKPPPRPKGGKPKQDPTGPDPDEADPDADYVPEGGIAKHKPAGGKKPDGEKKPDKADKRVAMGVDEVRVLAHSTADNGAAWLFMNTVEDRDKFIPPTDRISMIKFLVARSPPLASILLQVLQWLDEPKKDGGLPNRVLVMADSACIQK